MPGQFLLEWNIRKKDEGKMLKQFLKEKQISKTSLTDIKFNGGNIFIDGKPAMVRHILNEGEQLTVIFPEERASEKLKPEYQPLDIIFEDDYILIVNKPPFMNVIPSRDHPCGTLANQLMGHYQVRGIIRSPHIVTRLDRNTSGLVLIAKHRHIHHLLNLSQARGGIKKEYVAFIEGVMEKKKGEVCAPIARKPASIIERTVSSDGQAARTDYEVIQQYPDFAHVKLGLHTGRTHQIRVHMAYIGHPLLGDDLYGGNTEKIQRQALHCKTIKLIHPIKETPLAFSSALPDDMTALFRYQE